jgi:hypothetical protein
MNIKVIMMAVKIHARETVAVVCLYKMKLIIKKSSLLRALFHTAMAARLKTNLVFILEQTSI